MATMIIQIIWSGKYPPILPTVVECRNVPFSGTREAGLPPVTTKTTPLQKNMVPMVATRDGIPSRTTIAPFRSPARNPATRQKIKASTILPVVLKTLTNTSIPIAIMDGNDKSISPAITTIVNGKAIMAKNGIVDINAA